MKYYVSANFLYKIDETKPADKAIYHPLPNMVTYKRCWKQSANRNDEFLNNFVDASFITEEEAFEILL